MQVPPPLDVINVEDADVSNVGIVTRIKSIVHEISITSVVSSLIGKA